MDNYLQILIDNAMVLASCENLYMYIIEGGTQTTPPISYYLNDDNVATAGTATQYPILVSSLPTTPTQVPYFYFLETALFSGRIYFSTSNNLFPSGPGVQPTYDSGVFFDFVELTMTANSVNCDTTNVNALCIPITIIDPVTSTFPPQAPYSDYSFPNAMGIVPETSNAAICDGFQNYCKTLGLQTFTACISSFSDECNDIPWLLAPGGCINNFDGTPNTGLAASMDETIYQFFNYYNQPANSLVINFSETEYVGNVVIGLGADAGNPTQTYCTLNFVGGGQTYYIFYPYFSTNCTESPNNNALTLSGLPPVPTCWSNPAQNTAAPASEMVLSCGGAFADNVNQLGPATAGSPSSILGALENIVVSFLNRGLIPSATSGDNNLFICNGNMTLVPEMVTFTDPSPAFVTTLGTNALYTPAWNPPLTASTYDNVTILVCTVKASPDDAEQTVSGTYNTIVSSFPISPKGASNPLTQVLIQPIGNTYQFDFIFANPPTNPQFVGEFQASYPSGNSITATFTPAQGTSFPAGIKVGMNVMDINQSNPATVIGVTYNPDVITIQSTINGLLPYSSGIDTLAIGNFYPVKQNGTRYGIAINCWNAYAGFLHYGVDGGAAPYISNQGYGFAYDDDGGYSSDITIEFPESGNCQLGIYLGPLA